MQVAALPAALAAAVRALPRPVGFVPTMGALHAGHLELVRRSVAECAATVASIFVNPLQFAPGEDLDRYPRAFEADAAALEAAGVAVLYHPDLATMYPPGFTTAVDPGPIATVYEGALRPTHLRGVATVCTKLFSAARAERAYFGAKDAQQVAMLQRMVADLDLGVEIVVVPTVREADGLAFSSRNVYLSADERRAAPALHAALVALADAVASGAPGRAAALAAAREFIVPPLREAYLDIVDPATFTPAERAPALAIGSAWLGATRLLDNVRIEAA